MDRTSITKHLAGLLNRRTFLSLTSISLWSTPSASGGSTPRPDAVRPGSPQWPDAQAWSDLSARVGGRLAAVSLPKLAPEIAAKRLADPVFIGSEPGLTQSAGWVDAWQSAPSAYVLKARDAADVVQAVNFARHRQVRLVVRGGGHSYHGTSNAPDSLLVWTRAMNQIVLHDAFVPAGLPRAPAPAVSVGAGCTWGEVYTAVTTKGGRYVQGGGCTTVGVAGMLQGGGFGNFSKAFGLAAAHLLEAEIVTADGAILVVNAGRHPDLFWALKGGGGGTFGVVTRVTLETHDLPVTFGAVRLTLQATTDADFQRLLARFIAHYRVALCNPHWGEVVQATADNRLVVEMVFQGLDEAVARSAWKDLVAFAEREPQAFRVLQPLQVFALPARHFWNFAYLSERLPGAMSRGEGSDARGGGFYWTGDGEQAGVVWHGMQSLWLPARLLEADRRSSLVDAWFRASRRWTVSFHFNKGLAGAQAATLAASRDTAMNPQVFDAFALAIVAGSSAPASAGLPLGPELEAARRRAAGIDSAMEALRLVVPGGGGYLYECDYSLHDWQDAAWGIHGSRLNAVKQRYDPSNLFRVHHGVGSPT